MEHSRFMQLKKAQPESVGEVVWYKNKQPVSGISELPALMLGQAVITLLQEDRYIKVLVCILQNGDTGKAGILVGNQLMWSDHWGGCVDCDASLMRIRSADDGYGELNIPIDWALSYTKVSTAVAEQSHRAYCCSLRIKQDEEIAARHEALRVNTATVVGTDTRIRLAVASKHRVVLLPKQPTVVLCAGSRAGEIARGVDMVWAAEDDENGDYCLHEGVALMATDDADMGVMLNTDDAGETKLRVCNTGTTPIELEFGVELFQLRPAPKDAYEIAHIPDEVRALLSDEHREILLAMTQASDMTSAAYCARRFLQKLVR